MAIYTEQQAYQYLESISLSLEKIAKCLEKLGEAEITVNLEMLEGFAPLMPVSVPGSKSPQKAAVVQLGTQESTNMNVDSKNKEDYAPYVLVPPTPFDGLLSTTTIVPENYADYSAPSATPESSED